MRALIRTSLVLALATGCTFNAEPFTRAVPAEHDAAITKLRVDIDGLGSTFDGGDLVIRGADRPGASAEVTISGLVGVGDDPDQIASDMEVALQDGGDSVVELRLAYRGPAAESVWVDSVAIEQQIGTELDVSAGSATVDAAGLDAPFVNIHTGSGSIRLRDADEVILQAGSGSIDVVAGSGTLMADSGSITMAMSGPVLADTDSGSIDGSFGGHGELSADSGSLELELTTPLDGDVILGTDSGSITLVIPRGAGMSLDLDAGSGSVTVRAGGVSESGESFSGAINGGGEFRVRARAGSGSITVREAD
ncbi:DUF4097 family beta strand repeat-containing protein [Sandaracinus amylolyticus]|uniref:DUF4097 domain-containing protein n=1 Tax=Sandaracinus amylolyticus TaxID=927083 RepID=A0A0F6YG78_9BACT|nr:DUF4097 family beta strand repeat-containing protein [Sandaracinus amylolyticus]AKF03545.1 hypothetical protein DB32_000694 [Sandaracinus amylolyticus]